MWKSYRSHEKHTHRVHRGEQEVESHWSSVTERHEQKTRHHAEEDTVAEKLQYSLKEKKASTANVQTQNFPERLLHKNSHKNLLNVDVRQMNAALGDEGSKLEHAHELAGCSGLFLLVRVNTYQPGAGKAGVLQKRPQNRWLLQRARVRACVPLSWAQGSIKIPTTKLERWLGISLACLREHSATTPSRCGGRAGVEPEPVGAASWSAEVNQIRWRSGVRGQGADRLVQTGINIFIYIIYLFKVIAIQHKHTFAPQIMYFNRNNSYQDHTCFRRFLFISVPAVAVVVAAAVAEFVIYNSCLYHLYSNL